MTSDLELIIQRLNAGDYHNAERTLRSLLQDDPRNADAWMLLATLVHESAQKEACYRQVLRFDPGNSRAARRLAALNGPPSLPPRPPTPAWEAEETAIETRQGGNLEADDLNRLPSEIQAALRILKEKAPTALDPELLEALQAGKARVSAAEEASTTEPSPGFTGRERKTEAAPGMEALLGQVRLRTEEKKQGFFSRLFSRKRKPERNPGELSLAEMIELAGGGLPPGERRTCPNPRCGATVSKEAQKCPWCGDAL